MYVIRVSFVVALSYNLVFQNSNAWYAGHLKLCLQCSSFFVHSSVEQMAVPFMKLQGNPTSEQTLRSEIWIAFPVKYHSASEVMLYYLT